MVHKILVSKNNNNDVTCKLKNGIAIIFVRDTHHNLINIDMHHIGKYDLAVNQYLIFFLNKHILHF